MKKIFLISVVFLFCSTLSFADPTVAVVTNQQLQAVDGDGIGTYTATDKVTVTGIILNNPEEMLDPTSSTSGMGGQYQFYVQGDGTDQAGTAIYMAQRYVYMGGGIYTEEQWSSELWRLNHDSITGYTFQAGDRVRITGWYMFYKGKTNINEKHKNDPFYDVSIELVTPAVGLPEPEIITLDLVKDSSNQFIFDQTRTTGCEYYQGRLVRVDNVSIVDPANWVANGTVTIQDSTGRTFPVKLGIGDGFTRYSCPTGQISVVAVLDQEASSYTICKDGYRLWVTNYDGNGLVLTDRGHKRGNLPGDINSDYKVNFLDLAELAENWLGFRPGL